MSLVTRAAAFFDLDKTVIAKSSTLAFGRPFFQGGLINRRAVLKSAYAQFVFSLAGADAEQMERHARADHRDVHRLGRRRRCTTSSARRCTTIVDPLVYAEAADLIEEHRAAGREIVIVSSSGAEMVEPIGEMLGVDRVVATRMVVVGRPVHRRDRLLRLRGEQGRRDARGGRRARLRPGRLLRLLRLGHRPADADRGRPPHGGQPRPGPAQGRGRARLAGAGVHAARSPERADDPAAATGGHRGRRGRRRRRRRAGLVCVRRRALRGPDWPARRRGAAPRPARPAVAGGGGVPAAAWVLAVARLVPGARRLPRDGGAGRRAGRDGGVDRGGHRRLQPRRRPPDPDRPCSTSGSPCWCWPPPSATQPAGAFGAGAPIITSIWVAGPALAMALARGRDGGAGRRPRRLGGGHLPARVRRGPRGVQPDAARAHRRPAGLRGHASPAGPSSRCGRPPPRRPPPPSASGWAGRCTTASCRCWPPCRRPGRGRRAGSAGRRAGGRAARAADHRARGRRRHGRPGRRRCGCWPPRTWTWPAPPSRSSCPRTPRPS